MSVHSTSPVFPPGTRTAVAWFQDSPARGGWNMALDEALLQRAAELGTAHLRFYEWSEPTLSLGYFQPYEERNRHAASRDCAIVRRATGGGAILHDRELTYSCILPAGHPLSRRPQDLYLAIHRALVQALGLHQINAQILTRSAPIASTHGLGTSAGDFAWSTSKLVACGLPQLDSETEPDHAAERRTFQEPFLCFERRGPGDVLLNGWKIAGSAQRRHRGAVLQHGSVLLERSTFAPEVPGIHDLARCKLGRVELASQIRLATASTLGFDFVFEPPSAEITGGATAIEAAKFATDRWLRMR